MEETKGKVYLSGPITSDPDGYKEHFKNAKIALEKLGFDVTNPSADEYDDVVLNKGHDNKWTKEAWLEYIHDDINMVVSHDYICLLIGKLQVILNLVHLGFKLLEVTIGCLFQKL